jgi:biopolymer transport protein TolR
MGLSSPKKHNKKRQIISEINITPFVDVLLVLLIIFMVAAPMLTSTIEVNLPQGTNKGNNNKFQTITISIKSNGDIYLQEDPLKLNILSSRLKEISGNDLSRKIFVRADKSIDYGRVMEVVKAASLAGFSQIVLITETAK